MQDDLDMPDLRENEPAIFDLKAALRIGKRVISSARSKSWIARLFTILDSTKESIKAFIETLQYILQYLAMNRVEIEPVFLDLRQLILLSVKTDRLSSQLVSISSLLQSAIVKLTTNCTSLIEQFLLSLSWVYTIFEGFAHTENITEKPLFITIFPLKRYKTRGIHPRPR